MKVENIWDYPSPAVCEPFEGLLRVVHRGKVIAKTTSGIRVIEAGRNPTYYFPPCDVNFEYLHQNTGQPIHECKGEAFYYDMVTPNKRKNVAWKYSPVDHEPLDDYKVIIDYVSFFASKFDECWVNSEQVKR